VNRVIRIGPFVYTRSARAALLGVATLLLAACGPDAMPAAESAASGAAAAAPQAVDAAVDAAVDTAVAPALEPARDGAQARVVVRGVDLTGVGYDRGDPRAPIVMVEFSDFGCPYCAQHARETFPALERDFIATGKVFYKHVPFVLGMFPNGDRAARAAECAGEQDRFWPMHDSVYVHQRAWKRGGEPDALLTRLAGQVVADDGRWAACYAADRRRARTEAANAGARRLGVRATPTFFIDGQLVEGALPLPVMRQGLNALLRERAPR
jgi:protein-disulfide isomerase